MRVNDPSPLARLQLCLNRRSLQWFTAGLISLCVGFTQASTLGKMEVLSKLGAPLHAEIEVLNIGPDEEAGLSAKIASSETFKQAGLEFNPALSQTKVTLVRENGKTKLVLTTPTALAEPLLDVLIELNWNTGRLVREYTLLLDPSDHQTNPAPAEVQAAPIPVTPAQPSVAVIEASPAQPAPASVRPAPEAKAPTYSVRSGDTLYRIAAKLSEGKPKELSTILAAIYQNNPDAFVNGDSNKIKAGSLIHLPINTTANIDQASKVLDLSSQNFSDYKQAVVKSAQSVDKRAPVAASPKVKQGKVIAKVKETGVPDSKDQLKVAGSAQMKAKSEAVVPKNADSSALTYTEKLASKNSDAVQVKKLGNAPEIKPEDSVAKNRALNEEKMRREALEKNISELKKALELKNDKLTKATTPALPSAEKQVESAKPTAVAGVLPAPVVAPAAVVAEKPAVVVEAPKPVQATLPPAPPMAAPVAPAPIAAVKPLPAVMPKVPVPAVTEKEWFQDIDPFTLAGLGGVLSLIGGGLLWRNRRQDEGDDYSDSVLHLDGESNSLLHADGGQAVDTMHSAFSSNFAPANAGIDSADVDPLAEADVYMQYGRESHAIEILKDAIDQSPNNLDYRLKLMEAYGKLRSLDELEKQAKDIQRITNNKGEAWDRAQEIGRASDVNNPLYGAVSKQAGIPSFANSGSLSAAAFTPVAAVARALPPSLTDVDFSTPTAIGDVPVKDTPMLDAMTRPNGAIDIAGLSFATTLPRPNFSPRAEQNKDVPSVMNVPLDFDVSAPRAGLQGLPAKEVSEDTRPSSIDFKLSSLDFVNTGKTSTVPAASPMSKPPLNLSVPEFVKSVNGEQEFNTKLNLAEAYTEIGDKDGARELLQEVLQGGSAASIVQAKAMLEKL